MSTDKQLTREELIQEQRRLKAYLKYLSEKPLRDKAKEKNRAAAKASRKARKRNRR